MWLNLKCLNVASLCVLCNDQLFEYHVLTSFVTTVILFFSGRCPGICLENGNVTYDKSLAGGLYPSTTKVFITCKTGYYGPSEASCYYQGYWGLHPPRCDRVKETSDYYICYLFIQSREIDVMVIRPFGPTGSLILREQHPKPVTPMG